MEEGTEVTERREVGDGRGQWKEGIEGRTRDRREQWCKMRMEGGKQREAEGRWERRG